MLPHVTLVAQALADAGIQSEMERLQRNFHFLSYGLVVAWFILVVYLLMMVGRERKLKREIAGLKAILDDRQKR